MSTNAAAAQALLTCAQWKECCGVRMPRTRAAPTTRTPLSPACGCASTLDYAVLYRTISGIRNNRGSMCAMSCGYTTILYVYPACL